MIKILVGVFLGILLASLFFVLLKPDVPIDGKVDFGVADSPPNRPAAPISVASRSPVSEGAAIRPPTQETAPGAPETAEDTQVVDAIPLPSEFDWLSTRGGLLHSLHERIQREYRDDTWATPAETRLQSYVYERPEILKRYGYPTITCRTTLCEITFVGYGINDSADIVQQNLVLEMFRAPMDGLLSTEPGSRIWNTNSHNGITTIMLSFKRSED